jgi:hypothetical protein
MAGVTLYSWDALGGNPPATNYGVLSFVNQTPYLSFASGTTITSFFIGIIPQGALFSTNGLKVRLQWNSASATTGNCNWGAAYERLGVATVASDHFGTQVTQATAVGGVVDINTETDITLPYSDLNSSVAGDPFRLQIQRVTGGSDTMSGAAQLFTVTIEALG